MKLTINKEYNLNNVKQVEVTEDFLGLDQDVIECQKDVTYGDCMTRQYVESLIDYCQCVPFSIVQPDQVYVLILILIQYTDILKVSFLESLSISRRPRMHQKYKNSLLKMLQKMRRNRCH